MAEDLLIAVVDRDATDADIVDVMRTMRSAREDGVADVVLAIAGYESDKREVFEIPEARALCRRLVDLGFISYLSAFTYLNPADQRLGSEGLGAMEVWLIGQDGVNRVMDIHPDTYKKFFRVYRDSNAVADVCVGPMRTRE